MYDSKDGQRKRRSKEQMGSPSSGTDDDRRSEVQL